MGIPSLAPTHTDFTFQRRVERLMDRAVAVEAKRQIIAGKARQQK